MQVVPVIDLMAGEVVRGIAGRRTEYRPVVSRLTAGARPATVAQAFRTHFGFELVYVADLDAIQHGRFSTGAWQEIGAAGMRLWLDAGITDRHAARRVQDAVVSVGVQAKMVIGLESLASAKELGCIVQMLAPQTPIFSLDLLAGELLSKDSAWKQLSAIEIVREVHGAGIRDVVVLDLADVGVGSGTRTIELCRQIHEAIPGIRLIAGGGVRGIDDLRTLAAAGCSAALVASALHDGRLTCEDIDAEHAER